MTSPRQVIFLKKKKKKKKREGVTDLGFSQGFCKDDIRQRVVVALIKLESDLSSSISSSRKPSLTTYSRSSTQYILTYNSYCPS